MIKKITEAEKLSVVRLIAKGWSCEEVSVRIGLTIQEIKAILDDYYG